MGQFKYKAFISYSHRDEKWCGWLHRRLENYKIPKPLIGRETVLGPIPANLKPVFRDKDELSAGSDLGEHIQAALDGSEFLIVLCSPNSARSHWVNEEIIYFKYHYPDRQIFSIIVDGVPFVSDGPEASNQECFPPALRFQVDRSGRLSDQPAEPLAADVSERGDGKRLGSLRLISGMIGVGLDDLVQRDMKKERRRVTIITSTALITVLIMSGLTWAAMSARGAAERAQAEAEMRRAEAEGLTEFMLTDLKDKLVPLGKLDVMDGVADKVIEYYENYPEGVIDCAASSRHAQSLHLGAEIANSKGSIETFSEHARIAYEITKQNLRHCDNEERAIYDHGQSAFWRGYDFSERFISDGAQSGLQESAYEYFDEYVSNANKLSEKFPDNQAYRVELAHAITNIGILQHRDKNFDLAIRNFERAEKIYQALCDEGTETARFCKELSNSIAWQASALGAQNKFEQSLNLRKKEVQILKTLEVQELQDEWDLKYAIGSALRNQGYMYLLLGSYSDADAKLNEAHKELKALTLYDPKNRRWIYGLARIEFLQLRIAEETNNLNAMNAAREKLAITLNRIPGDPVSEKEIREKFSK